MPNRLFLSPEISAGNVLPVDLRALHSPPVARFHIEYTFAARACAGLRTYIAAVAAGIGRAQIFRAVVASDPIDVVENVRRLSHVEHFIDYSMQKVYSPPSYLDVPVSSFAIRSRFHARVFGGPFWVTWAVSPKQSARREVCLEQLVKLIKWREKFR